MIKAVTKLFIDAFIHPIFTLLVAAIFKIAVFLSQSQCIRKSYPRPPFTPQVIKNRSKSILWESIRIQAQETDAMRITELSGSQLGTFQIISIGLIDNDTIRHLHNTTLNPLQFIARTRTTESTGRNQPSSEQPFRSVPLLRSPPKSYRIRQLHKE